MNRLPTSQRYKRHERRWKRYEEPMPDHRVQIDVKFIAPIGGGKRKHYQLTAIDDCTRLRVLRIYDRLNQKTAIQFADYVLENHVEWVLHQRLGSGLDAFAGNVHTVEIRVGVDVDPPPEPAATARLVSRCQPQRFRL